MKNSSIHSILLMGGPGSGKGTLGKSLSLVTGFPHLSTGDLIRQAPPSSPLGQARKACDAGGLLSDELMFSTFEDYVKGLFLTFQLEKWIFLDGIPRTPGQVDLLSQSMNLSVVLHLQAPDEVLVERLMGRAKKEKREDDLKEEAISKRIQIYHENKEQILAKIDSRKILNIAADQHPLLVLSTALSSLVPFLSG